jgi:hypothetical protein
MSDSEDSNLSELEQEDAVAAQNSDYEDGAATELKGSLKVIEEVDVKWSDLVSLFFAMCFRHNIY